MNVSKSRVLYLLSFFTPIFGVFLFGLFLRFRAIIQTDLWLDESLSILNARISWFELFFQRGAYWDYAHPSLWYLVLKSLMIVSPHHLFLRSFSLLMYCFSFVLTFLITKHFKNAFFTFSSLTLLSFHPTLVNIDHQIRMYATVITCFLAFVYSIERAMSTRKKKWSWLACLALTFGLYLDYAWVWVIFATGITTVFAFLKYKKYFPQLLVILIVSFLGCIPQLVVMITHFSQAMSLQNGLRSFNLSWVYYSINYYVGSLTNNYQAGVWVVLWLIAFLSFVGIIYRVQRDQKIIWLILLNLGLSIVISAIWSIAVKPIYQPRNLISNTLLVVFGLSSFLTFLWTRSKTQFISFIFFVLLVGGYVKASLNGYGFDTTTNWTKIIKEVEKSEATLYFGEQTYEISPLTVYYLPELDIIYVKPNLSGFNIDFYKQKHLVILVSSNFAPQFYSIVEPKLCEFTKCTVFVI